MTKSILFVCQSCRTANSESSDRPADGTLLLEHILTLYSAWSRRSELAIEPVSCLWTCDHPCAVALSSPNKSTYVLAKVPVADHAISETAEAVLGLSQLYLDSQDGTIPWKHFPTVLQTDIIARIPPCPPVTVNQS